MIATDRAVVVLAAQWDPSIILYGAYLAGALLAGALAIELFRRYLRREPSRPTASDQLAHFRSLYEQGAISEEEFNSLRALLGDEIRQSARRPAPAKDLPPSDHQRIQQTPRDRKDTPLPDRPTPPPETGISV